MCKIKVDISTGKHSSKVPAGTESLIIELLENAGCADGLYPALLGAFVRGSNYQKGIKVVKATDTATLLQVQAGDNGTNVEVHLHCPAEYAVQDWFDLLKSVENVDRDKQTKRQKDLKKKLRKLCVLLNGKDTLFLDLTDEIVQEIGYKDFNSFRASIYNRDNECLEIQKAGSQTQLVWKEDFLEEVRGLHPNLGLSLSMPASKTVSLLEIDLASDPFEYSLQDLEEIRARPWQIEDLQNYLLNFLDFEEKKKHSLAKEEASLAAQAQQLAEQADIVQNLESQLSLAKDFCQELEEKLYLTNGKIASGTERFLLLQQHREVLELKLKQLEEDAQLEKQAPELKAILDNLTTVLGSPEQARAKMLEMIKKI